MLRNFPSFKGKAKGRLKDIIMLNQIPRNEDALGMLDLFFSFEDTGSMFLRNVGRFLLDYLTATSQNTNLIMHIVQKKRRMREVTVNLSCNRP
jgi:hypothetical protein